MSLSRDDYHSASHVSFYQLNLDWAGMLFLDKVLAKYQAVTLESFDLDDATIKSSVERAQEFRRDIHRKLHPEIELSLEEKPSEPPKGQKK